MRGLPLLLAAWLPLAAYAGCSREIIAPVSPNGIAVAVERGEAHGIYPDLLRSMGQKAGCKFVFPVVPRARQVAMFENGKADLLLPASSTAPRDQLGIYVPMLSHRTMLISVNGNHPPIANMHDLLERRILRVAVVRGFDYGAQYSALVKELDKQGRLFVEVDVRAVARLLQAGSADLAILTPPIIASAIENEPRLNGLLEKLRFDAIPELSWHPSGVYISRRSLTQADQRELHQLLDRIARSGTVLEGYRRHYRPELLNDSVRPR